MVDNTPLTITQAQSITTVTLNRPQQHNALNATLIRELTDTLRQLEHDATTRVVLLAATGATFCAGADLNWLKTNHDRASDVAEAKQLSQLLHQLDTLSKPCIALVQGPAYGGGIGLIACCDIAVASPQALLRFSEVKLGLIPAVISPYVIAAIGSQQARRYFITAESFTAQQAQHMGLIHEITDDVTATGQDLAQRIAANGPHAITQAKKLIQNITSSHEQQTNGLAEWLADIKSSPEAQEGIQAFFAKRKPKW